MSKQSNDHLKLGFDVKKRIKHLFYILVAINISLVLSDFVFNFLKVLPHSRLRAMVNMAKESSIANWYSTSIMLLIGLVALALAHKERIKDSVKTFYSWMLFGCFFIFLSMDDGAEIHERVSTSFKSLFKEGEDAGGFIGFVYSIFEAFPSYAWQLTFLPIFGAIGLYMLVFSFKQIEQKAPRRWLIYGLTCLVVAVGIDFIEGILKYGEIPWDDLPLKKYTITHNTRVLEEFLEVLGSIWILRSFLGHYWGSAKSITFQCTAAESSEHQ